MRNKELEMGELYNELKKNPGVCFGILMDPRNEKYVELYSEYCSLPVKQCGEEERGLVFEALAEKCIRERLMD